MESPRDDIDAVNQAPDTCEPGVQRLNSSLMAFIAASETGASLMLAIAVIFGFVAVLAVINFFEFGRVD